MLQAAVYCAVAGMLAARRTGGMVTPLLLGIGLSHAATAAAGQYAHLWLSGVTVPVGVWAIWAETWLYLPGIVLAAGILPIVLPGDRPLTRPRRMLLVFVATTAALVLEVLGGSKSGWSCCGQGVAACRLNA